VVVVALAVVIGALMPEAVTPVRVGDPVKALQLPDLQGKLQSLPEGKVMIVNFWATWCPPCRKEVPSMVKLYHQLRDKGLEIVAISVDKRRDDVVRFVREHGMDFTVLHDKDTQGAASYGVFRYPESFIVNREGVVVQHLKGAVEWTDPSFVHYLEQLLAESSRL